MISVTIQPFDLPRCHLPLGVGNSSSGAGISGPNNQQHQKQPGKQRARRILIVEDELLVAENIKEIIEAAGYEVIGILASGEQVIADFAKLDPDLILMDIRLSGVIDGIQTAIAIHYTLKEVPIIFMTAYGEDQFPHLAAVPTPLFKYVTKPCEPNNLTQTISDLFNQLDSAD